jgi:hypothetical protein
MGDTYLPEEEGEPLHSCEEILDSLLQDNTGPMGSPFGRPTHCVTLTTLTVLLLPLLLGPCMRNLLTRFIQNQINAVKLQLVRQCQRLPLDNVPKTVIREYDGEEEGVIRKPRERSKLGKEPAFGKALPLSQGPCIQLSP